MCFEREYQGQRVVSDDIPEAAVYSFLSKKVQNRQSQNYYWKNVYRHDEHS